MSGPHIVCQECECVLLVEAAVDDTSSLRSVSSLINPRAVRFLYFSCILVVWLSLVNRVHDNADISTAEMYTL